MPNRKASAVWEGGLKGGKGTFKGESGAIDGKYSFSSRFEEGTGSNPEELLAAAHATCFVTSLGSELARLGIPPERMHVNCTITMDEVEGQGHRIVHSAITARAVVPGADEATFAEAAAAADGGCPFSALIRGTATVTYEATLEGGS